MRERTKSADAGQETAGLSRREVLKGAAAVTAAELLEAPAAFARGGSPSQPNILYILVDEMRYPQVFPTGINTADDFMRQFMPNTYNGIWSKGVKFANHMTAATQCSPSRGVLMTGLYSQQQWLATTLVPPVGNNALGSPPLLPGFPTYGKLLRTAGYDTPYIGKWHCSTPRGIDVTLETGAADMIGELALYGFRGFIDPDPVALNLQGTYGDTTNGAQVYNDAYIANVAATYLSQRKTSDSPWALTVAFQNPHDQEFFPAGINWQTYNDLFANVGQNPNSYAQLINFDTVDCAEAVDWSTNILAAANVPSYGYPTLPPNWESTATMQANKPGWQVEFRQFSAMYFGGVNDSPSVDYSIAPYPSATTYPGYTLSGNFGIGLAPYSYWQKSLDCYTKIMTVLDQSVGAVLDALPPAVASNTIIVFTSDHGDYAGAHGLVSGKGASAYREAINVPLLVYDPTGRFAGDPGRVRTQLTSSVDMMAMLVSFGYGGTRSWMQGDLKTMYGSRWDMFPLLRSAAAPGRPYALFATDEVLSLSYDFVTAPNKTTGLKTPFHIVSLITPKNKLAIYSNFTPGTLTPITSGQQFEFYNYATQGGRLELDNIYAGNAEAQLLKDLLVDVLIPNELRAPLPPGVFAEAQAVAQLLFTDFLDAVSGNTEANPVLGFAS